jgi:hypothetical protein
VAAGGGAVGQGGKTKEARAEAERAREEQRQNREGIAAMEAAAERWLKEMVAYFESDRARFQQWLDLALQQVGQDHRRAAIIARALDVEREATARARRARMARQEHERARRAGLEAPARVRERERRQAEWHGRHPARPSLLRPSAREEWDKRAAHYARGIARAEAAGPQAEADMRRALDGSWLREQEGREAVMAWRTLGDLERDAQEIERRRAVAERERMEALAPEAWRQVAQEQLDQQRDRWLAFTTPDATPEQRRALAAKAAKASRDLDPPPPPPRRRADGSRMRRRRRP